MNESPKNEERRVTAEGGPRSRARLECVITYLEMRRPPEPRELGPRQQGVEVRQVRPTLSFYRYLYNAVGERWLWYERRYQSDEVLQRIIQHPKVEIHALYVEGVPAGFAELDLLEGSDVELKYFGLIPEFVGRGLGRFFLHCIITAAWRHRPERVWLHTCNFDHPAALPLYQSAGFVPYKREETVLEDPRILELMEKGIHKSSS